MCRVAAAIPFVMKLTWIVTIACIAGLAAHAQDGRGPGRGRFPGMNAGFAALDLNTDGMLDANEINAASASLAKLDKNHDGQITSDEVRPAMPEGRGRGGFDGGRGPEGGRGGRGEEGPSAADMAEETVKTLMAFDANGDGRLSKDELPERFQGLLARADENKDGFLTPDEIRKVAAAQAAPAGGGSGGRGDGGLENAPGEGRGGRGGGDMNFIRMDPILAAIDVNADGVISAEELRNAPAALRKLDKDGDGQISREEAMPAAGRRGGN